MNKQVKNIYRFFIPIILMFFVFLGLSVINVKAETGFIKNDNGTRPDLINLNRKFSMEIIFQEKLYC